jgi:hypothetical protein
MAEMTSSSAAGQARPELMEGGKQTLDLAEFVGSGSLKN